MSDGKVFYGTVIFFSKGFGFIAWEKDGVKQNDMFLHFSDINSEGFKTLVKGQMVSFEIGFNRDNKPKAVNINVLKH